MVFAFLAADEPWLWALAVLTASLGIIMLLRVPLVRVAYDEHTFVATGVLWSRRIELDQIDEVDVAPEAAVVRWTSNSGRARTTPLTAVNAGRLSWLPNTARRRRVEFLRSFESFLRTRVILLLCLPRGPLPILGGSRLGEHAQPIGHRPGVGIRVHCGASVRRCTRAIRCDAR
ncbi:hypothetical protein G5T42_17135 [Microbacterium sp. 4R-513]|uniref:hypothetical protein n=1 Tax=Microbacterium sp. 4R-513 TaxID=2567934 RepID=UPI0013E1A1AB|nr:hypothetical protein [Microbacterium sp. 4R-513]QIG40983.1 hypothetical protein G5T42_17135 [Microbacterium sp. 4R-513]